MSIKQKKVEMNTVLLSYRRHQLRTRMVRIPTLLTGFLDNRELCDRRLYRLCTLFS